jgi:hypothetical protein
MPKWVCQVVRLFMYWAQDKANSMFQGSFEQFLEQQRDTKPSHEPHLAKALT